ncbi:hypothetical protein niasHT_008170 [Heterodera trifolii]|uniref:BAG domain-containing protein n=1 Tax=Heterodera trifolii TaxID=157864 RepID=A0ABD2LU95_9BILA
MYLFNYYFLLHPTQKQLSLMERRRPIGLPRTRSTFAEGFFQPSEHPPLRRDPFDKFQSSIPSYNRFRDGISDPSSRMFNDDDLMFFDNFPRRPFYTEPEFFHATLPRNEEPPAAYYQTQPSPPREPMPSPQPPPPSHNNNNHNHHRSKSHYDKVGDNWERPLFHHHHHGGGGGGGESDQPEQMLFDNNIDQPPQQQHHFPQQNRHNQPPNDPNVHVIKIHHEGRRQPRESLPNNGRKFVEINNSVPNYELLNPDKRRRRHDSRQEEDNDNNNNNNNDNDDGIMVNNKVGGAFHRRRAPSIPNITIDDYSTNNNNDAANEAGDGGKKSAAIPLPAPAIPLPAPEAVGHQSQQQQNNEAVNQANKNVVVVVDNDGNNGRERAELDEHVEEHQQHNYGIKQKTADDIDLLQLLDETEHLTEQLRENAIKLEQEKETILDKINNIKASSAGIKPMAAQFSQAERDGMVLNMQRILARCNTVNISIETPRDQHQSKALEQVNKMIQSVLDHTNGNIAESKQKIATFLNACHPDEVGRIDEKFQSVIIECTADDQKKIRRKLAQIVEQMNQQQNNQNVKKM